MRVLRTIFTLMLAVTVGLLPGGARATVCQPLSVETFDVDAGARSDVYRIGDVALIDVRVVREATGAPVGEATVFVGLDWGHEERLLIAKPRQTAETGRVLLKVPLEDAELTPGNVTIFTYAYQTHAETHFCGDVAEYGFEVQRRAFRIKR